MHESRLHKGKSEDVLETGQGNSFGGPVRSAESAVQEKREREEDSSLISGLIVFKRNRAVEKSRRDFVSAQLDQQRSRELVSKSFRTGIQNLS
jgi:hypothetical protein